MDDHPICGVHIGENGDLDFILDGEAMFLVIDERALDDRVYR